RERPDDRQSAAGRRHHGLLFVPTQHLLLLRHGLQRSPREQQRQSDVPGGSGPTTVNLPQGDDTTACYSFQLNTFYFFGTAYNAVHVNSNGNLTFQAGADRRPSICRRATTPRPAIRSNSTPSTSSARPTTQST